MAVLLPTPVGAEISTKRLPIVSLPLAPKINSPLPIDADSPLNGERTGVLQPGTGFPADDHPADASEIEHGRRDAIPQRFNREPAHAGIDPLEVCQTPQAFGIRTRERGHGRIGEAFWCQHLVDGRRC